jgi:hypothetical protein
VEIFFIILFVLNVLIYSLILLSILFTDYLPLGGAPDPGIGFAVLGLALFLFVLIPLNIINVTFILTFLIKKNPHGKARSMSYAGLVLSSPVLILTMIYLINLARIN